MRIEVRCCCQPQKLLGWLDVEDRLARDGNVVVFPVTPRRWVRDPSGDVTYEKGEDVRLPVAWWTGPDKDGEYDTRLALKSKETPLEVLRRIPSFVENRL